MSWRWEYAFAAEEAARTAPPTFLAAVEAKAAELVRAAETLYLHGRSHRDVDPKGGDITVPGGMFSSPTCTSRSAHTRKGPYDRSRTGPSVTARYR